MIYYSYKNIDKKKSLWNLVIGERSNGKTYGLCEKMIKNFFVNKKASAYIRRYAMDIKGHRGQQVFAGNVANGQVEKYSKGKYNGIRFKSRRWTFILKDEDENILAESSPFCYAFALAEYEHDKSTTYPDITIIGFDEFISRDLYLEDEFTLLANVLSTIIRQRGDAKIYLLANTVNMYSPYFKELGLKHVRDMQPGQIDVYTYNEGKTTLAIEYCDTSLQNKGKKDSNKYFGFDNPKLSVIKGASWEIPTYPHAPCKYFRKNILFTFFIIFEEEMLQCEIIARDNNIFMFVHRKTTPLRDEKNDLIYQQEYNPAVNYRRKITIPQTKVESKIADLIKNDKVFFQDNLVGETFRNYLHWCAESSTY